VLLGLLLAAGCSYKSTFTDRALEEKFRSQEAEFNRLVHMFKEDRQLSIVNSRDAFVAFNVKANLPPPRFENYRDLLKQLNLNSISRGEQSGNVYLARWNKNDFFIGGSNEYYVYAEFPPAEEMYFVDSLDHLRRQTDAYAFKKIAAGWYMHVDNW
jgi:hypothetical protein